LVGAAAEREYINLLDFKLHTGPDKLIMMAMFVSFAFGIVTGMLILKICQVKHRQVKSSPDGVTSEQDVKKQMYFKDLDNNTYNAVMDKERQNCREALEKLYHHELKKIATLTGYKITTKMTKSELIALIQRVSETPSHFMNYMNYLRQVYKIDLAADAWMNVSIAKAYCNNMRDLHKDEFQRFYYQDDKNHLDEIIRKHFVQQRKSM